MEIVLKGLSMGYNPIFRGSVGKGSSRQNQTGYTNGTPSTIAIATPVSINVGGNMIPLDVTDETSAQGFLGLTSISTPSAASGLVVNSGRLEGLSLVGFTVGDAVYAGPTPGSLTNVKPDRSAPGWSAGMFVIFLGCYVVNQFNGGLNDIQLMPTLIGVL